MLVLGVLWRTADGYLMPNDELPIPGGGIVKPEILGGSDPLDGHADLRGFRVCHVLSHEHRVTETVKGEDRVVQVIPFKWVLMVRDENA